VDTLLITSVGCGDCDVEVQVARRLVEAGVENFRMTCIDISEEALARGRARIAEAGLEGRVEALAHDFNQGLPPGRVDVVMANQSLHHVVELERLFASIRDQLPASGCFLVSDVIGRNGHQRWPEARELIDLIWGFMPARYRFHCQLNRQEDQFMDWDCSKEGFEGIRAQDVLPLLLENFHPSLFATWGNLVDVFVDRGFGHHFRALGEWDLNFVDRVQEMDSEAIASGRIKPTHLLARFQREACECVHLPGLPPQFALRPVPIGGSGG
jgi:SAM-dependent methyltransferase